MTGATTVLVVDDDASVREIIQGSLAGEGYRVLTASNGQAALDVLHDESVDLILLDMNMPVMDGRTFARNYHRQQPPWAPVVAFTAAQDAAQAAAAIGAGGHLNKPFELTDLLSTVEHNRCGMQRPTDELVRPGGITRANVVDRKSGQRWPEPLHNPPQSDDHGLPAKRPGRPDSSSKPHVVGTAPTLDGESFLAALVSSSDDAIIGKTLDATVTAWNTAAQLQYGYTAAEMIGQPIARLIPSDRSGELPDILDRLRRGERVQPFETVRLRKDGRRLDVQVTISPVIDAAGRILGAATIARDITEQRAASADLLLQSAALGAAANSIIITNQRGAIEWANPAFSRLTGYSLQEVRGQNPRLLKSGQQDAAFYANLWKTILAGQVWRGQLINRHKNGRAYSVEMTITPVRDERNEINHFIAIHEDITQRLVAELTVQTATAEMAAAQQIAHLGSWEMDLTFPDELNRNPIHWSAESFRIFGYLPGLVEVTNELMFERIHPDDRAVVRAALMKTIADGAPNSLDYRIVLRDATERIVRQRDDIVYDVSGQPCRLVGSVQDITERKRIELELAKLLVATQVAQSDAESAVRARDEFLTIAAHELKTPVTVIKLVAQMLNHGTRLLLDPPHAARLIQTLDDGASRLARLVEDLLDVARLQTGQLQVRVQELDLSELVVETIAARQSQLSPGHELVAERNASPCLVSGDADRLQQVLSNLIDNSVKYSPHGGCIRVSVQADQDGYIVQVKDQGIGVPAGSEDSIFEPFGRANNATQGAIQGMGLGLHICRQIVGSHGGRIWAVSGGAGQGTTMNVWLPRSDA